MIPVSVLGTGKCFGELALQKDPNHPTKIVTRQATIETRTNCKFAVMSKSNY